MRKPRNETSEAPVRRCILTGERAERGALVRLALSPDGKVLPDIRAKAPGRGAWVGVNRAELTEAMEKGRLRGALARAFKTGGFEVPVNLPDLIAEGLQRATLERLGLEARSGFLLTGSEKILTALHRGEVGLLLHAEDSSADGRGKLAQTWRVGRDREGSGETGTVLPADRNLLSNALGRQNAVHVALLGDASADRVLRHLGRWLYFIGWSKGAVPAAPGEDLVAVSGRTRHECEGSELFDE